MAISVHFDLGTIVLAGVDSAAEALLGDAVSWDPRTKRHRAPAHRYRDVILKLHEAGIEFVDQARQFGAATFTLKEALQPYPHQRAALSAFVHAKKRGVVELPTGSGKTILAVLAIEAVQRPTLVVVPTIDLLHQWHGVLTRYFQIPIGRLGGGFKEREAISVTTYDSASFQTEFHGNCFGFIVFDECHHLPATGYQFIAEGSIAPFRLGLTATFARADGREEVAAELIGPMVHQVAIDTLEGKYLAPYEVKTIEVDLSPDEAHEYHVARQCYLNFLRSSGVDLGAPDGWARFIQVAHRTSAGKEAFRAYRRQRKIALTAETKMDALWKILVQHTDDRVIIFTEDNQTVYQLSERLFIPAITHQTPGEERKRLLEAFANGRFSRLVTAKVLNEGVDVPDANVGIILSGSGSVREHVQRLGRILRKKPGKAAILYEVFANVAAESGISERRRQHRAYARYGQASAPEAKGL